MSGEEIWKDIPGFEGAYQISSMGRVKSLPRAIVVIRKGKATHTNLPGKILRQSLNRRGYQHIVLRRDGNSYSFETHCLVAKAFLGERPVEHQVRHLDGNSLNNCVENLCYGTRSANQLDVYNYRGYHHKLTPSDVKDIRNRLSRGETGRSIAKLYAVGESNISAIKHGGTYAWLK